MGVNLLDTEFRGGTQVTLQARIRHGGASDHVGRGAQGRGSPQESVHARKRQAAGRSARTARCWRSTRVRTAWTSDKFRFRSLADNAPVAFWRCSRAAFKDEIQTEPALEFTGSNSDAPPTVAYPLMANTASESVGRPVPGDASDYHGGVAIVLDKIDPPVPLKQIQDRLERRRLSEFSDTLDAKAARSGCSREPTQR